MASGRGHSKPSAFISRASMWPFMGVRSVCKVSRLWFSIPFASYFNCTGGGLRPRMWAIALSCSIWLSLGGFILTAPRFIIIDGRHRIEAFIMYKYVELVNRAYKPRKVLSPIHKEYLFANPQFKLKWPAIVYPNGQFHTHNWFESSSKYMVYVRLYWIYV